MASMFNLGDVLQLIINSFDNRAFSEQDFVREGHEFIFHIFLNLGNELKVLPKQEIKERLGNVAFITEELTPNPACHFGDWDAIIGISRGQFKGE